MRPVEKPPSFKRKVMAMYANQFYMRPMVKNTFLSMLEHGLIVNDRQAVEFIENNGEFLS